MPKKNKKVILTRRIKIPEKQKRLNFSLTTGQILAERFSKVIGSWFFIIAQTLIIITWVLINLYVWWMQWDPYPFIFLNLFLSVSAAYAAPIILMAQNRGSEMDRIRMINDLATTRKAEREIEQVQRKLEIIERKIDILPKANRSGRKERIRLS